MIGMLLAILAGARAASPPPAPDPAAIARVESGLRAPVLVEGDPLWTIAERLKKHGVPGVSVAVIRDFRIEWAKGYGLADVEGARPVSDTTLFEAGSISKPVAAAAALALVARGRLTLKGDIDESLKSWKVPANALTRKSPVTLERLLSHSAGMTVHGFPGYERGTPLPTVVQVLDGTPPANTPPVRVDLEPGTQYRYSGGGYTVAQLAMTDATGEPFPSILHRLVLEPLGMTLSTYEQPLPDARLAEAAVGYRADGKPIPGLRNTYPEMAAAGLWTTASDLARFGIGMQRMLRGEAGPLSPEAARDMVTPRGEGYGLGLAVEEKGGGKYFTHGGSDEGFQSLLYAHESKGYGAVLMTNSDAGFQLMPEILRAIGAAYGWDGFQVEPLARAALSPETLARFSGRFALDSAAALAISPSEGGLAAKPSMQKGFALIPISADTFVRRDQDARYVFRNGDLSIVENGKTRTARRLAAGKRLPAEELEAGHLDAALAGYRTLRKEKPSDPAVAEASLNELGYNLLRDGNKAESFAVLRLNSELYPESANTWDSLAEATEESGDTARAIELYRKALRLASRPQATSSQDASARTHATERLKALGATP
ncbi:MAG TPA: serine hydrolase [Thermoanaerobaculia bacterium]|nr:serine hydrolase [Thermoanaerobaculia bacterium]